MSTPYKPDGYTSAAPFLIANGAGKVIDFLKKVFGAEQLRRYDTPDGSIIHAEVRIDDTVIMLGESGGDWPAVPSHVHVYVPDVDTTFRRAVEAGGTVVQEPQQQDGDPDRRGGIKDPAGNTWWVATQVSLS